MEIRVYDFNAFGRSHKSVGVDEVLQDALDRNVDTISIISSGNYIGTILFEVRKRGLEGKFRVVNLVNGKSSLEDEISMGDNLILRDSEERAAFVERVLGDAGKVVDYTDFQPKAYESEAENILGSNPQYIGLGVGSGKLFLSLRKMIQEKGLRTKLVGILPKGENGVFNDDNLHEKNGGLFFRRFNSRSPADKLVCPYTFFKPQLLEAVGDGHLLVEVSNRDLRKANRKSRKLRYDAEVSGSAGFVLYDSKFRAANGIPEDSEITVINTGRGYNWEKMILRERKRRFGCFSLILGASALLLGLFLSRIPSSDLMVHADLDKDGVVTGTEIWESHLIVGTYDWNEDWRKAGKNYEEIRQNPWVNNSTLLKMKKEKERLTEEVVGYYDGDFDRASRDLWGLGGIRDSFEELSHDQLLYLRAKRGFITQRNPEIWTAMRFTNWYDRLRKLQEDYM